MPAIDAIIDETVDPKELKKFEAAYLKELDQGNATTQTTFEYANFLIRSKKDDVAVGLRLFEDLLNRDCQDEATRDYLYFLAVGNIRLKNYDKALGYVDAILRVEPANKQAEELRTVICNRMYRDGLIGGAMLAGVAMFGGAALAAGLAFLARGKRRK
uniref:Mitochondrial fission 1 protein n=1 Tax=Trichuris muris TaxID=70415 RepID=A0A5S6R224_TRIMR